MVIICSQCGTQCEDDMRFCSVCGAPLRPIRHSRREDTNNPPNLHQQRQNNRNISIDNEIRAPSLYETLTQAKDKSSVNSISNSVNTEVNQGINPVVSESKKVEVVSRPIPSSRTKVIQKLRREHKVSDISSEKSKELKELLRSLNKLDKLLEASAIMKRDGTILASAISDKYGDNMMSMIAMNIFDIATDSIKALSGGNLKVLHIIADNALVILSYINSQTLLVLITSPKSQIGLISMYSQLVSQKIDKVLNS
ncbi:MAG: zinc-ribbon domain-containing protein [Candidatus Helarchaeota archaeon]